MLRITKFNFLKKPHNVDFYKPKKMFNTKSLCEENNWEYPRTNIKKARWVVDLINYMMLDINNLNDINNKNFNYFCSSYKLNHNCVERELIDKIVNNHFYESTYKWSAEQAKQYCVEIKESVYLENTYLASLVENKIEDDIQKITKQMIDQKNIWIHIPISIMPISILYKKLDSNCTDFFLKNYEEKFKLGFIDINLFLEDYEEKVKSYIYFQSLLRFNYSILNLNVPKVILQCN